MPVPRSFFRAVLSLALVVLSLALETAGAVQASPPASSAAASAPDYGGRDAPLASVGDAAPDPAGQAVRALEALVVVLAGIAGTVYLLKRFHLVQPGVGGKPARISGPSFGRSPAAESGDVAVVSSQSLPGGMMLHVVRVAGKNLLLAATAQSVTTITEWSVSDADRAAEPASMADEFAEYLARADTDAGRSSSGIAAANARLRSLLSAQKPEEPS